MTFPILDLLDSGSFRTYQIPVARYLGSVNAAIMLSELINRHKYHHSREELIHCPKNGGNWFYYTVEMGTERTFLSDREQATAIKTLIEKNIVEARVFGLPAKRHFRLKIDKIATAFGNSKSKSSYAENAELDTTKAQNHICGKRGTATQENDMHIHIKENKEEHQERVVCCAEAPKKISVCEITSPSGEKTKIRIDDLYTLAVQENKDWTAEEIEFAWKALSDSKQPIRSWEKFTEGVINNARQKQKSQQICGTKKEKGCQPKNKTPQMKIRKDYQEQILKSSSEKQGSGSTEKDTQMRPLAQYASPKQRAEWL